ncbi:Methyltransferase type 11 [Candidatus Sulfopaludibacter sp. SbA4]|nr:Methyltransferase type 11 [Candidatus Sulfopaludibacter sp. SbA4]
MAIACPVDLDTEVLRSEISKVYSRVAADPNGDFHFHRGAEYAAQFLGYDPDELAALPAQCTASFAGIANPHAIAPILPAETVLDIGCGAGMDLLLAARRVGPGGRAIGMDMTEAMRDRARASAAAAGLTNVEVYRADATALPLPDASVDVVISNGVLNLVPEKERAFAEIKRVLRPGGRLQLADIVLDAALGEDVRRNIDLWTG